MRRMRNFLSVRTDKEVKPQAGISFLLIDMASPGIEVAPIITLAGDHEVNQVFFENVRVPAKNLVGAENDGWSVKTLLTFERLCNKLMLGNLQGLRRKPRAAF